MEAIKDNNSAPKVKGGGGWFLSFIALIGLILLGAYFLFFIIAGYNIGPGSIGVRQIKFGPFQGFAEKAMRPGAHWGVPGGFYTTVYILPQTLQLLDFNRDYSTVKNALPSLEIQTADRASVNVDITIATRFYSERGESPEPMFGDVLVAPNQPKMLKHGGPAELIQTVGTTADRWTNFIKRAAENELKRSLGAISTGEFYDPKKRELQIALAHETMNRTLAPVGIRVEAVLLRRYTYRDGRIDDAIFQKNLQDQEERFNLAGSELAKAQAALEQVAAEADAKISTLKVEGDNKSRVIISEGDLYESEKRAQGDLKVASAKAEVDKLRSGALARTQGSEIYVAKELAPLLSSVRGGVVSGLDPYDLDAWIKRLGVAVEPKQ